MYVRFNGGWINTDAIVHDANQPTGFFSKLDDPKVGCLVVFPSKRPRRPYGHIGIVTEVSKGEVKRVIHCSLENYRKYKDAVRETPPTVFRVPDAIFVWFEGIEQG